MIYINCVEPLPLMRHAKFQNRRPSESGKEVFLKITLKNKNGLRSMTRPVDRLWLRKLWRRWVRKGLFWEDFADIGPVAVNGFIINLIILKTSRLEKPTNPFRD